MNKLNTILISTILGITTIGTAYAAPAPSQDTISQAIQLKKFQTEEKMFKGKTPAEIFKQTRDFIKIYSAADVLSESSETRRIGDEFKEGMDGNDIKLLSYSYTTYAMSTIMALMESGAYPEKSLRTLKSTYIPFDREIRNTVKSFSEGSITVQQAQYSVRALFSNFVENLEQVQTTQ